MKTLTQLRNHPAVQEIILESDHGRRTYWINLNPGFATDHGRGQQSGSESTLRGVAAFLRDVRPVNGAAAEDSAEAEAAFRARVDERAAEMIREAAAAHVIEREAAATLHADSPRPVDAEATRRAVIALAPAYSVLLADGKPAAVELESRAADGLEPEFLSACAEEGAPVDTLAAHLRDIEQRAGAELDQAKQLARTHGTGRAAVDVARNVFHAITQALAALATSPTPPPAPKPADVAPVIEREAAAADARRDFQAAAASLRAYVAHAVRFSAVRPAERAAEIFARETHAADALAAYAAALGTRNAAGAYAAALDACVACQLDLAPSGGFPALTSPAWLAFAADVAGVIRAKWETENAAIQAHVAAARAAAEGERAAPAPDAAREARERGATPAGTPAAALPLPGAPEGAHGPATAPGDTRR